MWHFNGEDDATRCGRKGPDSATALARILSDLYKGEEEEFLRIKTRDGFSMYNPQSGYVAILFPASLTLALSAKITRIDVSEQELRRAVEGIFSPSPQPEDLGRALDPGFEEDPDITVEVVNGVFYQASWDGALVAITADYPGLLPASRVSRTKKPYLRRGLP